MAAVTEPPSRPPATARLSSEKGGGGFGVAVAEGAGEHGDGHGGFEALAADVADGEEFAAVGEGEDLVEVAADLLGGLVEGVEAGGLGVGDEELLDGTGGLEFAGEAGFFALHGAEEEDDHGEGGGGGYDRRE